MPDITEILRVSLTDDMTRMQTISRNLSNVHTPAYKREVITSYPAVENLGSQGVSGDRLAMRRDFSPGALKRTDYPLDLAIAGQGYFELVDESGHPAYSRRGNFHLDEQGQLSLGNGYRLQGEKGILRISGEDVRIDSNGQVIESHQVIDRIRLVSLDETSARYAGEGIFRAERVQWLEEGVSGIRQHTLEMSNVDNTGEMLGIIESTRRFETTSRLLTAYDKLLGESINTLGDF